MDKRLAKRHKREVARAKSNARESVPDVRTPEQKLAAKELSRPSGGERKGVPALFGGGAGSQVNRSISARGSAAKSDA